MDGCGGASGSAGEIEDLDQPAGEVGGSASAGSRSPGRANEFAATTTRSPPARTVRHGRVPRAERRTCTGGEDSSVARMACARVGVVVRSLGMTVSAGMVRVPSNRRSPSLPPRSGGGGPRPVHGLSTGHWALGTRNLALETRHSPDAGGSTGATLYFPHAISRPRRPADPTAAAGRRAVDAGPGPAEPRRGVSAGRRGAVPADRPVDGPERQQRGAGRGVRPRGEHAVPGPGVRRERRGRGQRPRPGAPGPGPQPRRGDGGRLHLRNGAAGRPSVPRRHLRRRHRRDRAGGIGRSRRGP